MTDTKVESGISFAGIDESLARQSMLHLTTTGRRSRLPRTTKIWFVVDGDCVYVQAGPKGVKGWYANLRAHPAVTLEIGGQRFQGVGRLVTDPAEARRVLQLVREKYWLARAASWFGSKIGRGRPVAITPARSAGR